MINLLNLTDAEDIYSLMAGLAEDAHGGSMDQCAQRQLDAMEPFRVEICAWARGKGDPEAKQARHETGFPKDRQKAFDLGARMAADPWGGQ